MKHFLCSTFALVVGLPIVARGVEDDNPFKKVKEGDWVKFTMTMVIGDFKVAGEYRKTVTAKSDKEVTIKTTRTMRNGRTRSVALACTLMKATGLVDLIGSGVAGSAPVHLDSRKGR